jgi:hypothetical protein
MAFTASTCMTAAEMMYGYSFGDLHNIRTPGETSQTKKRV